MELTIQNVEHLTLDGSAAGDVPDAIQSLVAQEPSSYSTPDLDPSSLEYTEGNWNGDEAMSNAPNPSDGEQAKDELKDMVALYPTEPAEATDNKANYKLPFRMTPDGPVNLNGVSAAIAAINGARGGVDAPEDDLRAAYNFLVALGVEGGEYDDTDSAPDFSAKAAADGADTAFRASVAGASPDGGDDLSGVVWAAGDHTLYLNGQPTPVHVPEDSIPRTFQNVKDRIAAGEPPKIGLDHGDSLHEDTVPVASELDVLTIGQATGFDLSEDGTALVMTDYELTKDEAVDAAENGQFAGKDYSIVGNLRIHTDDDGTPKTVESGGKERLVVTAESVRQVDVVADGAVDGAGPGQTPPLQTAAKLASKSPMKPATAFTSSLRFMAKQTRERNMKDLTELENVDDPDAVLEGAAEVVEHKDERIQRLQAVAEAAGVDPDEDAELDELTEQAEAVAERAEAAETLADFHDVDLTAEDGGGVQALVDAHTEDLRKEVAAKEATLPKYDTDKDTVQERAEELKGKSPSELQAMDGQRATEILESEQARQDYGKAFAAGDGADGDVGGASSGAGDDDVEAVATNAMTVDEKLEFRQSDHDSAAEFMAEKYDEDPADYVGEDDPSGAFVAATAGTDGEQ